MMTTIKRTTILCNHISLSVLTAGPADGKMVLLLHGFPETAESWNEQMIFLASLGFFVVAPDQRGYNESSAPDSMKDYKLETLALDMLFLVKHFRNDKIFIVAHDWGAVVGWYLITFFPETFEKAIIASAPHWDVFRKYLLSHPKQMLKSWYIFFIQLPFLPEFLFGYKSYSVLSKMLRNNAYPESKLSSLSQSWIKHKKLRQMLNWYRAVRYLKVKRPKSTIQVKTHIVWGEQDPFCLSDMAPICREYCKESKLTIMSGAGHWPQHQKSHEFNVILKSEFIEP